MSINPEPQVHRFESTTDAYGASQTDDSIRNGDVLVVADEQVVGVLVGAWPVAVTAEHGAFHTLAEGSSFAAIARTCLCARCAPHLAGTAFGDRDCNAGADDYSASAELAERQAAELDSPTTQDRLAAVAERLNGKLVAYRRITADESDERYAIAYSFGGGAWCVAVVDAATGAYHAGTSHVDPMTAGNVGRALEQEQTDTLAAVAPTHPRDRLATRVERRRDA